MKLISLILVAGVALQIFSRQVVYFEYKINQNFISGVLCEKKALPDNSCQGKCHLKKQLTKNEEQSEKNNPLPVLLLDLLFFDEQQRFNPYLIPVVLSDFTPLNSLRPIRGFSCSVFRPPSGLFS